MHRTITSELRTNTRQVGRVENLEFADGGVSRVGEVAPGAPVRRGRDGEGAESGPVRGRLVDDVHARHVANVVDEQRLLETHDQDLKRDSLPAVIPLAHRARGFI